MKTLYASLIIGVVTVVLLELALRIYNPIFVPLRANQIYLPVNHEITERSPNNAKVDEKIVFRYNGLGLRGPDYPDEPEKFVKIFTVGGSTTACILLNDGQTWPDILFDRLTEEIGPSIWLNNAGFDGHSTYGHSILLNDHLKNLQPDYILYLVGINDIGREDLNEYDKSVKSEHLGIKQKVIAASELLSTLRVFYRSYKAFDAGVNYHYDMDITKLPRVEYSEGGTEQILAEHRKYYLQNYGERIQALIKETMAAGAVPVFLTQPALMGQGRDPSTGVELSMLSYHKEVSALAQWQILEEYNGMLRTVASKNGVQVIDLASIVPKDSRFYFDWVHYSREGARFLGNAIADALIPVIGKRPVD